MKKIKVGRKQLGLGRTPKQKDGIVLGCNYKEGIKSLGRDEAAIEQRLCDPSRRNHKCKGSQVEKRLAYYTNNKKAIWLEN